MADKKYYWYGRPVDPAQLPALKEKAAKELEAKRFPDKVIRQILKYRGTRTWKLQGEKRLLKNLMARENPWQKPPKGKKGVKGPKSRRWK